MRIPAGIVVTTSLAAWALGASLVPAALAAQTRTWTHNDRLVLGTPEDLTTSLTFVDVDGDGDADAIVANDMPENWVYLNDRRGRFALAWPASSDVEPRSSSLRSSCSNASPGSSRLPGCTATDTTGSSLRTLEPRAEDEGSVLRVYSVDGTAPVQVPVGVQSPITPAWADTR